MRFAERSDYDSFFERYNAGWLASQQRQLNGLRSYHHFSDVSSRAFQLLVGTVTQLARSELVVTATVVFAGMATFSSAMSKSLCWFSDKVLLKSERTMLRSLRNSLLADKRFTPRQLHGRIFAFALCHQVPAALRSTTAYLGTIELQRVGDRCSSGHH